MLDYENDVAPRLAEEMTPSQIADAINTERRADPINYGPITHRGITLWLSTNGLAVRFERWLEKAKPTDEEYESEDPADQAKVQLYQTFGAPIKALIASMQASDWSLDFSPGSDNSNLLLAAISVGIITSDDKAIIDNMAYIGGIETEATVQDAIDRHNSVQAWWGRYVQAGAEYLMENPEATASEVVTAIAEVE